MNERWEFKIELIPVGKHGARKLEDWVADGWEVENITQVSELPRRLTVVLKRLAKT